MTLEKLFERLCQDPSEPGTPEENGLNLAAIDHDFNKRRKEVRHNENIFQLHVRHVIIDWLGGGVGENIWGVDT